VQPRFERTRIDGIAFHLRLFGDGAPILLLHGFPDAGFRVIVADLRGCGETEVPAEVERHRLERLVADVLDLTDAGKSLDSI
jgi:pimeloyl-ACP methyl ester carboxylesterase